MCKTLKRTDWKTERMEQMGGRWGTGGCAVYLRCTEYKIINRTLLM